jgi:hypothetical protein
MLFWPLIVSSVTGGTPDQPRSMAKVLATETPGITLEVTHLRIQSEKIMVHVQSFNERPDVPTFLDLLAASAEPGPHPGDIPPERQSTRHDIVPRGTDPSSSSGSESFKPLAEYRVEQSSPQHET